MAALAGSDFSCLNTSHWVGYNLVEDFRQIDRKNMKVKIQTSLDRGLLRELPYVTSIVFLDFFYPLLYLLFVHLFRVSYAVLTS